MAIDLCSEQTSRCISFSRDLCQSDITATTEDRAINEKPGFDFSLKNSNPDIEFQFEIFEQEFSSADELFSGGFLLPMQIHERVAAPKHAPVFKSIPPRPNSSLSSDQKRLKENNSKPEEQKQKQQVKSFWSFKKNTSLSSGDQQQQQGSNKRRFITLIPLLLRRSNSTGSVPNEIKKTSQQITTQKLVKSASAHTPLTIFYAYKMQVKKNDCGGRITPVLHVPPPYITKCTANLFGLGSLFRHAKDKKNKRSSFS